MISMFRSYDGSAVAKDVDSEELDLWFMRQTLGNNFSTGGRESRSKIKFHQVTWYVDFHPTPQNRALGGKKRRCKWSNALVKTLHRNNCIAVRQVVIAITLIRPTSAICNFWRQLQILGDQLTSPLPGFSEPLLWGGPAAFQHGCRFFGGKSGNLDRLWGREFKEGLGRKSEKSREVAPGGDS